MFLGGHDNKVLMIDNSNNKITEIKGIGEWTYSAAIFYKNLDIFQLVLKGLSQAES